MEKSTTKTTTSTARTAYPTRHGGATSNVDRRLEQQLTESQIAINELQYEVQTLLEDNKELAVQQRNKEEFISMISHDLKNPLTPILAFSDMLVKKAKPGALLTENDVKSIYAINQSAKEMKQLIDDLMSVYKLELHVEFSYSETDIQDFVEEVVSELSPIFVEKSITIERRYFGSAPLTSADATTTVKQATDKTDRSKSMMIVCDQLRIKQVLINLIKNSVDFVPNQNGKISVIVEHPTEASIPFEFQSSHTNDSKSDNIMIAVTDNGKGIPSEKVHNLFRKFYQVDPKATRRHGGTGLGLTICKEIVEAHGGKIWYDAATSAYNGACFRFVLPRHPHSANGIR